ncbi:Eukaryotic translation initiation factor SUI1 family protein [Mycena chlorophos]|uniref:Eukaryotic translation initiation factor SUI1 family protein n=1 Tax=Mycena chlorophos TaxID=658473 RepID=A0A8H6TMP5_MYCCL|nr:Eukaryotic translation initiation factor SUI1 family protein [Mycena chlorophos]
MFKKPLSNLKTSAPLRNSDRKKLRQRVVTEFSISVEDADELVPEGILSIKCMTHLDEPGVVYLAPDGGDPLWFTIGKGSDALIPSVYTLWKRKTLLPFLSTPAAVIPKLVDGADLMIPGVVHIAPSLKEGQLVSICKYTREGNALSPPLAVGQMALSGDEIENGRQEKGKAVYTLHTIDDHLWEMGSKPDVPESSSMSAEPSSESQQVEQERIEEEAAAPSPPTNEPVQSTAEVVLTPDDVSLLLHQALIQSLSTALANVPPSTFPMSGSIFYSTYILPYRPAYPELVLQKDLGDAEPGTADVSIKTSGHKSLTAFLKAMEKASLLTLKAPPKHSAQSEVAVTAVNAAHPSVEGHKKFATVKDIETTAAKKAAREEKRKEEETESGHWVEVKELWKPHVKSLELFEAMGANSKTLYALPEIRSLLNDYIASKSLVNAREQAYINLDTLLTETITAASKSKKGKTPEAAPVDFMKRDELTKQVVEQMQPWHEVRTPGKDPVVKKGALKPIQVVMKLRQGRRPSTLITGFEPFLVVSAEDMAEDLRKICAGATSVSPAPGNTPGQEVLVQGKQSKAVSEYLMEKGVPKKWIETKDQTGKK